MRGLEQRLGRGEKWCLLLITDYLLLPACYLLLIAYYLLLTADYLLWTTSHLDRVQPDVGIISEDEAEDSLLQEEERGRALEHRLVSSAMVGK